MLDREVFEQFKAIIYRLAGVVLTDDNRAMVEGRIQGRMRELKLQDATAYLNYLISNLAREKEHLINALTTNMTAFFREKHHFEDMANAIEAAIYEKGYLARRKIRIWSAGCSSGEEAYSIAMTLLDVIPDAHSWDCRILATDIDSAVLQKAVRGVYPYSETDSIPSEYLNRWFVRGKGQNQSLVRVKKELSDLISFRKLNLIDEWPLTQKYDFVFCRNVLIYFDENTIGRIIDRINDLLKSQGRLFVGHSENLLKYTDKYELVGNSVYKKKSMSM